MFNLIWIKEGKIAFSHDLFRDLSDRNKSLLNGFVQGTRDLVNDGKYPSYASWASAVLSSRRPGRTPAPPVRVESIPFENVYDEGMELQAPVHADALADIGGMSVTATQQGGSRALAHLNDNELGIIERGLRVDGEHLKSVEDLRRTPKSWTWNV